MTVLKHYHGLIHRENEENREYQAVIAGLLAENLNVVPLNTNQQCEPLTSNILCCVLFSKNEKTRFATYTQLSCVITQVTV